MFYLKVGSYSVWIERSGYKPMRWFHLIVDESDASLYTCGLVIILSKERDSNNGKQHDAGSYRQNL